jgi:hypothetical protein
VPARLFCRCYHRCLASGRDEVVATLDADPRSRQCVALPLADFADTLADDFKDELVAQTHEPIFQLAPIQARVGPRVLIVRLSAMGDLIHGIPVVNALRRAMPDAMLGWVAEARNADLLEGHPSLDRLIRVPRRWMKSPSAVLALRKELRGLRFDTAIDLQCLTKSAIAA